MGTALVVEDSLTEREILTRCLQQGGIKVSAAANEEEALKIIEEHRPDVIILDVVLPGKSGFEICRNLKSEENTKDIPIILCSTKGTEMDKFWGLKQGADFYIPKPIDQNEFVKTVQQILKT